MLFTRAQRALKARWQGGLAAALAAFLPLHAGHAANPGGAPLRVCADPDNLPFTSKAAATPGLYMELAQHLAAQLGQTMEPVWAATYSPERMLRTTLLAHKCDLFIGVPAGVDFMAPQVILSQPVLDVGYALVTPPGSRIGSLADLAGHAVAVQFNSPVQDLLARRDDVTAVTVTTPEEGLQALQQHRAAAALLWGPPAGYLNRTALEGRDRVTPVVGENLQWRAAIAFAAGDTALRDRVDAALKEDGPLVGQLAARYGFPVTPVADHTDGPDAEPELQIPTITKDTTAPQATLAAPVQTQAAPAATAVAGGLDGHVIFNGTCAACHGPDAIQDERRINLRLLHARYGDDMDTVFFTTVMAGRPTKGMPSWKGAFTDAEFHAILAWLHTVQDK
jgi:polar amino acid transport system substrate-binding protein